MTCGILLQDSILNTLRAMASLPYVHSFFLL